MSKKWTEEEDKLIVKLRKEGFNIREIALRLTRTYNSVRLRLADVYPESKQRAWTEEEVQFAISLKGLGRTNKHIALKLDRTAAAVAGLFARLQKGEKVGS